MTDKHTLDLAREWVEWVHDNPGMYSDIALAAADVVASLPDEWVDAGNLQRFIDDWERLDPDGEHASLLDGLRRLLPTPPTMAETEWDDAEHAGLVARHKHGQLVRMLVPSPVHTLITCANEDGTVENYRPHNLTPLEGTKIDLAPAARHEATPERVEAHEVQPQHLYIDRDGQVFDAAYTYRDKDGDVWEHQTRTMRWRCCPKIGVSFEVTGCPPTERGPYTRIEDTK